MENQFVPYELALKLKELGFNEECIAFYTENAYGSTPEQEIQWFRHPNACNSDHVFVSAPLWQQAFDWFREDRKLYSEVTSPNGRMEKDWEFYIRMSENTTWLSDEYNTYEEARKACIEKLIKIIEK